MATLDAQIFLRARGKAQRLKSPWLGGCWVEACHKECVTLRLRARPDLEVGEKMLVHLDGSPPKMLLVQITGIEEVESRSLRTHCKVLEDRKSVAASPETRYCVENLSAEVSDLHATEVVPIYDISEGGLAIGTACPMRPNVMVQVRFRHRGELYEWKGRVAYSRPDDNNVGFYRTGIALLRASRVDPRTLRWITQSQAA